MSGRPLHGRRLLVTRRPEQSAELSERLRALGAEVVELPAIETALPEDVSALDGALRRLGEYDWVAFTSPNAVQFARERLDAASLPAAGLGKRPRVAAVGPATTASFRAQFPGVEVALEPAGDFRAEGLLAAFAALEVAGRRVLLPVSDRARDVLAEGLRARGAVVDAVVAYRTVAPAGLAGRLEGELAAGVDAVLFASPSAVENLVQAAGELIRPLAAVVMGPVTERAARDAGLRVVGVASPSTIDGLVDAVLAAFPSPPGSREGGSRINT